jgi:hypothetical protein
MEEKLKNLKSISAIIKFTGWIIIVLTFLNIFYSFIKGDPVDYIKLFIEAIITVVLGLILVALDGLINLAFKIYDNTRLSIRQNEALNAIEEPKVSESIKNNLNSLHKLISEQKKKTISSPNGNVPDLLRKMLTDKGSCQILFHEYKRRFDKNIIEHLTSLSSSIATVHFYVEPFIELDFCERSFPHKIIE